MKYWRSPCIILESGLTHFIPGKLGTACIRYWAAGSNTMCAGLTSRRCMNVHLQPKGYSSLILRMPLPENGTRAIICLVWPEILTAFYCGITVMASFVVMFLSDLHCRPM